MNNSMQDLPGSMKYFTYVWLTNCAENALERGKANPEGSAFMFMSANMFCALAIEAHLNHVGSTVIPGWEIFERNLSIEKKLELISLHKNFKIDASTAPFQFLTLIKKFRDEMAHGRTAEVTGDFAVMHKWPRPKWLEQSCQEVSERWFHATEKMIELVHIKAGLGERPLDVSSFGSAGRN